MRLVESAFVIVLVGVLAATVIAFAVMGLAGALRARRLARKAHQGEMRFFRDDPYDLPRRYAGFAVIASGHSPLANNVTDGRMDGRGVRAFDFRCELGHGTRRTTRHYHVLAAETGLDAGTLLMWHQADGDLCPLEARAAAGRAGDWTYRGDGRLAAALALAGGALAGLSASIEVRGGVLLVSAPGRRLALDYAATWDDLRGLLAALRGVAATPPRPQSSPMEVENRAGPC